MKKKRLKRITGLLMAVMMCIQPLTALAGSMPDGEEAADAGKGIIRIEIAAGEGTVSAAADGTDTVTIDQDSGAKEIEYEVGTEVTLNVSPGEKHALDGFVVTDTDGNELERVDEFPEQAYQAKVSVGEGQKKVQVFFVEMPADAPVSSVENIEGYSGGPSGTEEAGMEGLDTGAEDTGESVSDQDEKAPDVHDAGEDGQETRTVTFRLENDEKISAKLTLAGADDKEVILEGGETVLEMPVWTYIRMGIQTSENTDIRVTVTNEDGIELEKSSDLSDVSEYTREITVSDMSKVVTVAVGGKAGGMAGVRPSIMPLSADQPYVGEQFTGTCAVTAIVGGNGHTVHSVTMGNFSGILAGATVVGGCAQHSAAAPTVGMVYNYTYTITGINQSTGEVTGSLYAVSQVSPATGATDSQGNLTGYQALSGSALIYREYNGYARLQKTTANAGLTENNGCYSIEGTQYGVYSDSGCTAQVETLTVDAGGNSNTVSLSQGTYYVKETRAGKGYALDPAVYPVTVTASQTAVLKVSDEPVNDPAAIEIAKIDQETGDLTTQGAASLAGAQFTVKFYAGYYDKDTIPEEADRTWVLETKEAATSSGEIRYYTRLSNTYKVSGDDFYYKDGIPTLPLGTVTIEETKAPAGYMLDGAYLQSSDGSSEKIEGLYIAQITQDGNLAKLTGGNSCSVSDRVIRGDFEFTKRDEETKEAMAGIPFKITSHTTGESHTVMTDENGYYSSASEYAAHSHNTNGGNAGDGLWFGLDADGENVEANDAYGALPYDTYTIEELRCDKNEDKVLYKGTLTITRNGYTVDFGTIENPDLVITTVAKDEETNTHYAAADDEVTVIDTVSYTGLKKGKEYTLKGSLVNKSTGEALCDSKGKKITSERDFTPRTAEGSVETEFTFDATGLAGVDVVVYEEVYLGSELVAEHKDINDEGQTIYFPGIRTDAADSETGTGLSKADSEITIIDTVSYQNLQAGRKYTLTGVLMDRETGEEVRDADGDRITAETEFTPETSSGTVDVTFTFDGSGLGGKTLVAFETLERNDKVYAVHADIGDEAQTVHVPEIGTTALDQETGTHLSMADSEVTVTDTVAYKNLVPGKEYTLKGILADQKTGDPVKAGAGSQKEVTAELSFTPETADGTVDVEFTFDGSGYAGETFVIMEELFVNDTSIAEHKDLEDEGQTIHVPEIGTTALDKKTDAHMGLAEQDAMIADTVSYENLIPGEEYTLRGTVMIPETGEALAQDGKKVTVSKKFIAEKSSGTVEMEFSFDASGLAGRDVVIYEELYLEGALVAAHRNPEDEGQTVHFPELETEASDSETKTDISKADQEITIIDKVSYSNVIPGKKYKITGVLMDQETGEEVKDADGNAVTAETEIRPEQSSGTAEVVFVFDGSNLGGKTLVAFETLGQDDKVYAVHADLEDEAQTIYVPEIGTTALDQETGTHLSMADSEVTVTDTVAYKNLVPGQEYTLKGILVDQKTGDPVKAGAGSQEEVTAELLFTPETTDGTVDVEFTFDGSGYAGETFVVTEELFLDDASIAEHKDLEDEGQTVYLPKIGTAATDKKTGTHEMEAAEEAVIVDLVSYENLIPGEEYTVKGQVMLADTGEALAQDGKEVTVSKKFIAEKSSGNVEMEFSFDASGLAGRDVVIYEEVYLGNVLVAEHKDLEDEGQTVAVKEKGKIVTSTPDSFRSGSVKTGDSAGIAALLMIAAAALCGIAGIAAYKKRKQAGAGNEE